LDFVIFLRERLPARLRYRRGASHLFNVNSVTQAGRQTFTKKLIRTKKWYITKSHIFGRGV